MSTLQAESTPKAAHEQNQLQQPSPPASSLLLPHPTEETHSSQESPVEELHQGRNSSPTSNKESDETSPKTPKSPASARRPRSPIPTLVTPPKSPGSRYGRPGGMLQSAAATATTAAPSTAAAASSPSPPASHHPKEKPVKKSSNSGIPLRLKTPNSTKTGAKISGGGTAGGGSYNRQIPMPLSPMINKNTLEVQFMNNKKRMQQMYHDLTERQRPLMEIHKSLMRTKRQLDDMGKKVQLEPLKMITLKGDDDKSDLGGGETPINEATLNLKSSVEMMIESFAQMCRNCLAKQETAVKMLESVSKAEVEIVDMSVEVENMRKEQGELEQTLDTTVSENEKKIADLVFTWQQVVKNANMGEEAVNKINELEEKVKHQQKLLNDADDNAHHLNRKYEEKRAQMEKNMVELNEKIMKLEDDVKKEKKNAAEIVIKSRTIKNKLSESESKAKETEEKLIETTNKLKQAQEVMRKKEVQWMKDKDDFKKNEALLQSKFAEKQFHLDARLKSADEEKKKIEEHAAELKVLEDQVAAKDAEIVALEKDKEMLNETIRHLEEQVQEMTSKMNNLNSRVEELSLKRENANSVRGDHKQVGDPSWTEAVEYKRKISEVQKTLMDQTQQITKMQSSLKAHAQLAVALKLEKDNAVKFSNKLRDILREARDEIDFKNKTIYKIHEKLVLKEAACDKLKAEIKEIAINSDYTGGRGCKETGKCQLCMSSQKNTECPSCYEPRSYVETNTRN